MFSLFYLLVKTTKRDFGNIKHAEIKQVLSFNPNQAKLFWPLRNRGGEESRRSSFCKPIMLTFQLGPLFFICRHFLDIL